MLVEGEDEMRLSSRVVGSPAITACRLAVDPSVGSKLDSAPPLDNDVATSNGPESSASQSNSERILRTVPISGRCEVDYRAVVSIHGKVPLFPSAHIIHTKEIQVVRTRIRTIVSATRSRH